MNRPAARAFATEVPTVNRSTGPLSSEVQDSSTQACPVPSGSGRVPWKVGIRVGKLLRKLRRKAP